VYREIPFIFFDPVGDRLNSPFRRGAFPSGAEKLIFLLPRGLSAFPPFSSFLRKGEPLRPDFILFFSTSSNTPSPLLFPSPKTDGTSPDATGALQRSTIFFSRFYVEGGSHTCCTDLLFFFPRGFVNGHFSSVFGA